MEKSKLIEGLRGIVNCENVLVEEDQLLYAAKDYVGFRRHERLENKFYVTRPACVVKVKNTAELSNVMKFLNDNNVDIVPRTGGSSVTRGIEPQEGGVIVDASEMNELFELNEKDMFVRAGCGMALVYIENYLNERGYTTGHSPQSLPMAQLGGLVATRSIGQFSTLYGGIEDMVLGLEAVMADGEVVRIKNVPRRSTGPDLRHVFIGNEGMLGFVTEVSMKIFTWKPEERWMNAYAIEGTQNGLDAIREIMVAGYRPAVVRLQDPVEVQLLFNNIAPEGYSLMLFLSEGPKAITEATGKAIEEIVGKYKTIDLGKAPVESWLIHRNDVCQKMDSPDLYNQGIIADTCEISACWSQIGEIYKAVLKRMPEDIENLVFIGGHSSHSYLNGTNIYFQFGFKYGDVADAERDYMNVIKVIMEETLARGGSIAHHHGSGKYRTPWMPQEHGTSYPLMYKLKASIDPKGIMNKGVILVDEK